MSICDCLKSCFLVFGIFQVLKLSLSFPFWNFLVFVMRENIIWVPFSVSWVWFFGIIIFFAVGSMSCLLFETYLFSLCWDNWALNFTLQEFIKFHGCFWVLNEKGRTFELLRGYFPVHNCNKSMAFTVLIKCLVDGVNFLYTSIVQIHVNLWL